MSESVGTRPHGIALCLSGGGYRAALFHLGALRRLNELGVLSRVETIASVSGGSILAAHLATAVPVWPAPGEPIENWEEQVAAPFRRFTGRDVRTWPVLKRFLFPWNWLRRGVQAEALATQYARTLTSLDIQELPERPRYVLCATDITHGVNWIFTRDRVGDFKVKYRPPAAGWKLSAAVAASSCFPPVFSPITVREMFGVQDSAWSRVRLTDGGVYDNLGLEPVWKDHATILVSDGGSLFEDYLASSLVRDWKRYIAIFGNQVAALRKRSLIGGFEQQVLSGAYWGIGAPSAYSADFVSNTIARIRTDMNGFSAAEIGVLENHGYALADATIQKRAPALATKPNAAYALPSAEWADETRAGRALVDSARRFSLRRILRRRV